MIYELRFGGWDTDINYLCTNSNNPTQAQFRNDVIALLKKYGKEYLSQEDNWAEGEKWIVYIIPKLNELGYYDFKPITTYFQTPDIINDGQEYWEKVVGTDLFNLAVEHNKKLSNYLGCEL
jgi:hypothetical protein